MFRLNIQAFCRSKYKSTVIVWVVYNKSIARLKIQILQMEIYI